MLLGFGMVAYRNLLFTFIILFLILTIIMFPAIMYYKQGTGITNGTMLADYSLGNMGYSTTQCSIIPIGAGDEDYIYVPI
jgi:hypothetical protein